MSVFFQPGDFYAGIGSRSAPENILNLMGMVASKLEREGVILRSGAAEGSDQAFESGVVNPEMKCIYLPWEGFCNRQNEVGDVFLYNDKHREVASRNHPRWYSLSESARKLHTRNVAQVLGDDCMTPSKCVICWTSDGNPSGGTGQAIRIAYSHDIPVFNMYRKRVFDMLADYVNDGEFVEDVWIP